MDHVFFLSLHCSYSTLYRSSKPIVGILQCVRCVSAKAANPPPPKVTPGRRFLRVTVISGTHYYSTNTPLSYLIHLPPTQYKLRNWQRVIKYTEIPRTTLLINTILNHTNKHIRPPLPLFLIQFTTPCRSGGRDLRAMNRVLLCHFIRTDMISSQLSKNDAVEPRFTQLMLITFL